MKSVDYDLCYATLGLDPGASLEQIQLAWRLKASAMHPDNFADGAMKEEATRSLAQINVARDVLRSWWQQYHAAPPTRGKTRATASGATGMSPPPPMTASPSGGTERTSVALPQPNIIPSRWTREPVGPPPFAKGAKHRLYDWFMRAESYEAAVVFWPTFLFASLVPNYIIDHLLSAAYGIPFSSWTDNTVYGYINLALWIASSVALLSGLCYDYDLYKHLETPFIDYVAGSPESIVARLGESLKRLSTWHADVAVFDAQSDQAELSAELRLGKAVAASVNIRVAPSGEAGYSFVCFWFTASETVANFVPVSKAVRDANMALRAKLKG